MGTLARVRACKNKTKLLGPWETPEEIQHQWSNAVRNDPTTISLMKKKEKHQEKQRSWHLTYNHTSLYKNTTFLEYAMKC